MLLHTARCRCVSQHVLLGVQDLLCATYHLRASGFFQQLVEAGRARVVPGEGPSSTHSLAALIELLHALQSHQQRSDSTAALPDLAEKVGQHAAVVFEVLPDVATDAALALWEAARPVLEGAVGAKDMGADLAVKVILSTYLVDNRMRQHERHTSSAILLVLFTVLLSIQGQTRFCLYW